MGKSASLALKRMIQFIFQDAVTSSISYNK